MQKALSNLINHTGIAIEEALRMCSLYPAKAIGLNEELGKLAPGYRADMVVLNAELKVVSLL
jgi:N-acetylglucosamine-6-phosphate deacetylase